ncbi:MAG: hypothetical protein LBN39_02275 [Planctomycetaceae bacterium]|jgi:hypothetical protein|nr:hypothetical protein [Planctomycetaceae bacterium]
MLDTNFLIPPQAAGLTSAGQVPPLTSMNPPLTSMNLPQTAGLNVQDIATFSPAANMMQQFLNMDIKSNGETEESGESDLSGLAQLKQRGEMLANMLQMKLKTFGANLMTGMNNAGLDPAQQMNIQNSTNGLSLLGETLDEQGIDNFLKGSGGKLQEQFKEIEHFAKILDMLKGTETSAAAELTTAKRTSPLHAYTQQSLPVKNAAKRPDAEFVLNVMQGDVSYSFE